MCVVVSVWLLLSFMVLCPCVKPCFHSCRYRNGLGRPWPEGGTAPVRFDPDAELDDGLWRGSPSTMGVPVNQEQLRWMVEAINEGCEDNPLFTLHEQYDGELFILPVGYPHFVVNAEHATWRRSLKIAFDYVNSSEPSNLVYHAVVQRLFISSLMGPSQAEDYSNNDAHIVEGFEAKWLKEKEERLRAQLAS